MDINQNQPSEESKSIRLLSQKKKKTQNKKPTQKNQTKTTNLILIQA